MLACVISLALISKSVQGGLFGKEGNFMKSGRHSFKISACDANMQVSRLMSKSWRKNNLHHRCDTCPTSDCRSSAAFWDCARTLNQLNLFWAVFRDRLIIAGLLHSVCLVEARDVSDLTLKNNYRGKHVWNHHLHFLSVTQKSRPLAPRYQRYKGRVHFEELYLVMLSQQMILIFCWE